MVNSRDRVCKRMICFGLRFCNLIEVGFGSKVWSSEVEKSDFGNKILVFCYRFGEGEFEVVDTSFRCLRAWVLVLEAFDCEKELNL